MGLPVAGKSEELQRSIQAHTGRCVETQLHADTFEQGDVALAIGKCGKCTIALDVGDADAPVEVSACFGGGLRRHCQLGGPTSTVLPAHAPVVGGTQDACFHAGVVQERSANRTSA